MSDNGITDYATKYLNKWQDECEKVASLAAQVATLEAENARLAGIVAADALAAKANHNPTCDSPADRKENAGDLRVGEGNGNAAH